MTQNLTQIEQRNWIARFCTEIMKKIKHIGGAKKIRYTHASELNSFRFIEFRGEPWLPFLSSFCDWWKLSFIIFGEVEEYQIQTITTTKRGQGHFVTSHLGDKISAHFGDNNFAQMSHQICSHTPSALNAGTKQSDVPYDHASMLLLDEGSEATEPYNKHANLFENIS